MLTCDISLEGSHVDPGVHFSPIPAPGTKSPGRQVDSCATPRQVDYPSLIIRSFRPTYSICSPQPQVVGSVPNR